MDTQNVFGYSSINNTSTLETPTVYHILSGSFRSLSLFLLAFYPANRSLSHLQTVSAFGPHQYLAYNNHKNHVYTTSWATPPSLSSWRIERSCDGSRSVSHINTVPITATSSYITLPPPYSRAYSVGGPTGEVHLIDPDTGGFAEKLQQVLFVPESQFEKADKTRVALRYGSHGIEFTPSRQLAFVPVLGSSTIEMYTHDRSSGHLTHLTSVRSPRGPEANDGPRHVKVHPNGKILYCVTEHSNLVDSYKILSMSVEYLASRSLVPRNSSEDQSTLLSSNTTDHFRGDTLLLSPPTPLNPTPNVLVATTRGSSATRGWLSVFPLDADGNFIDVPKSGNVGETFDGDDEAHRFRTPTSGGKANAIDILPKSLSNDAESGLWILLTDDDDATVTTGVGAVRVLEWDGWTSGGVKLVSEWPSPDSAAMESKSTNELEGERIKGASHAIWLD